MKTMTEDAMIVASRQDLIDTIKYQASVNDQLHNAITTLTMQLDWLKRQVFGPKSERFTLPPSDQQMALELGVIKNEELETPPETKTVTYDRASKKKPETTIKGHGRGKMPDHLRIDEQVIEPEGDISGKVRIGEEVTWYFEMSAPSALHVVMITRPKYAFPDKSGVVIGALPSLPVEKGNAGPSLLTQIVVDKFLYHIPLYRQIAKYKSEYNVDFSESWFSDNVKNATFWLESAHDKHKIRLLQSDLLQADETPIPVLVKDGKGKTHRGYLWVYRDPINKLVIFDYRPNRSRAGPSDFLKDFKGTLQIDGYEGYAEIISQNSLIRAGCMDHVRRRFEKALGYDAERATHALDTMGEWYALERDAKEKRLSAEDTLSMRREKIKPSMEQFKIWMLEQLNQVIPKSPIGIAITYALNQWSYFEPFLNDPRVDLSNIQVENVIRPVALGRKNFMFAGSHESAQRIAIIYSIIATAKLNGVDPFIYIKELLTKLPAATTNEIEKYLLPEWKPDSK